MNINIQSVGHGRIENDEFRRFIGEYDPPIEWVLEINTMGWSQKYRLIGRTHNKDGQDIKWYADFNLEVFGYERADVIQEHFAAWLEASKQTVLHGLRELGYDGKAKQ